MNIQVALNTANKLLKSKLKKNLFLDTEILLSYVLKISREKLLLNLNNRINIKDYKKFIGLVLRRQKGEPIAYIVGQKEFWNEQLATKTDYNKFQLEMKDKYLKGFLK